MATRAGIIQEIEEKLPKNLWDRVETVVKYMKYDQLAVMLLIIKEVKDWRGEKHGYRFEG